MEGKVDSMDVSRLGASDCALLSANNQMVITRAGKSNIPTFFFLEIFYYWCILRGLPLNLPYIILSHMKIVLANKKDELPYGVILIVIAKRRNVNLSVYVAKTPFVQGLYGSRLLQNMGFRLLGKV